MSQMKERPGVMLRVLLSFASTVIGCLILFSYLLLSMWREWVRLWVHRGDLPRHFSDELQIVLIYAVIAIAGWLVVGPLVAVIVPSRIVARIHPIAAFLSGGALGMLAMLILVLIFRILQKGLFDWTGMFAHSETFWVLSAGIAAPAVACYFFLVRLFYNRARKAGVRVIMSTSVIS